MSNAESKGPRTPSGQRAIWKFPFCPPPEGNVIGLLMPKNARILTVQTQGDNGSPCVWALVQPEAEKETRTFAIYATGQPTPPDPGSYRATFMLENGSLVFHMFEITPEVLMLEAVRGLF